MPECDNHYSRAIWCRLPKGHHGRHACAGHCDVTWANEAETAPCVSTVQAVLGVVGAPARVRCGLLDEHDGPHVFSIGWTDSGAAAVQEEPEGALVDALRWSEARNG